MIALMGCLLSLLATLLAVLISGQLDAGKGAYMVRFFDWAVNATKG
ncbi:hypothetical protein [Alcanivorax sp.]